jgi:hypothetical protein
MTKGNKKDASPSKVGKKIATNILIIKGCQCGWLACNQLCGEHN